MKKILTHFVLSVFIILWWKFSTDPGNYAWDPKGKELWVLEFALQTIFIYKTCFWLVVLNIALLAAMIAFQKKYAKALLTALMGVIIFVSGTQWVSKQLAQSYFTVFLNQSVDEENIEKPILQSGYHIGGYLTTYIQERSVEYRRYAISGLGKIEYEPAIKVLEDIVNDSTEEDYIRADALSAIKTIGTHATE